MISIITFVLLPSTFVINIVNAQEGHDRVTYYLINQNVDNLQFSWTNQTQWYTSYNRNCPMIMLIHGWRDNVTITDLQLAVKQFDKLFTCHNIVLVNWSGALEMNYFEACLNAIDAGERVSDFFLHLNRHLPLLVEVHCVGHSLGAHICGMIGRTVHEQINWQSITGLDPAGPGFTNFPDFYYQFALNANDAPFVAILHTNDGCTGTVTQLGHADFYANGGGYQPGCGINCVCSHIRSIALYAESIVSRFTATSYAASMNGESVTSFTTTFGFPLSLETTRPGKYYFNTNAAFPYRLKD